MKPLTLTQEHRSQILEMVKVLFPEYYLEDSAIPGYLPFKKGGKYGELFMIHWFEFCTTHLIERILNSHPNRPNRSLWQKLENFYMNSVNLYVIDGIGEHPVDYLYKQFKELHHEKTS